MSRANPSTASNGFAVGRSSKGKLPDPRFQQIPLARTDQCHVCLAEADIVSSCEECFRDECVHCAMHTQIAYRPGEHSRLINTCMHTNSRRPWNENRSRHSPISRQMLSKQSGRFPGTIDTASIQEQPLRVLEHIIHTKLVWVHCPSQARPK